MKNQTEISNKSIARYTPGPWVIKGLIDGGYCISDENGFHRATAISTGEGFNSHEATKSNAHLIAAAPELLNALKAMIHYHGECDFQCKEVQICKHEMARQAIAKAEGK